MLYLIYILMIIAIFFWFFKASVIFKSIRLLIFGQDLKKGRALLFSLTELGLKINPKTIENLPEYKFYTTLIVRLLSEVRTRGIKIKDQLADIKSVLSFDLKFEEKMNSDKKQAYFQFLLMGISTWTFIFFSKNILDFKIPFFIFLIIFLMQLFGFISFVFFINKIEEKLFTPFYEIITRQLLFQSLIESAFPLGLALKESQVLDSKYLGLKKFKFVEENLVNGIERLKREGLSIRSDLQVINNLIFEMLEEDLRKFQKKIDFVKFLHLALVFLPAYFIYLGWIFKFFMDQ